MKHKKISVDRYLKVLLFYAFRNRETQLVAIEFKHGGRLWRADTVDEAIALRRRLEANERQALESGEEPEWQTEQEQVWTPDNVVELMKMIGPQQKKFLQAVFETPGIKSDAVMKQLRLGSAVVLAGVLSGLSKQLKKLSLKPWDLYTVRVQWTNKEKERSFYVSSGFHAAASELEWPEKWI